jgi:uncharacterized protein
MTPEQRATFENQNEGAAQMKDEARKNLATSCIAAVRVGDAQTFRAIMTDDVVWSLPGTSTVSGPARGVDGVLKRAPSLREYKVTLEIQHVVLGYDGAALLLHTPAPETGGCSTNISPRS